MGMEDEVGRHTIVVANKSRKEGIEEVPTTVPDRPLAGGVKTASEISKQRLARNAGIVDRGATRRESDGRSTPIRRKPDSDLGGPNKDIDNGCTTPKDQKDPKKSERANLHDETRGKLDEEDHLKIG